MLIVLVSLCCRDNWQWCSLIFAIIVGFLYLASRIAFLLEICPQSKRKTINQFAKLRKQNIFQIWKICTRTNFLLISFRLELVPEPKANQTYNLKLQILIFIYMFVFLFIFKIWSSLLLSPFILFIYLFELSLMLTTYS